MTERDRRIATRRRAARGWLHAPRTFDRQSNHEIIEATDDFILIRDLGPHDQYPTVTNAAEQVVAALAPLLRGRRLEYFDSEGERAQLLVVEGRFAGFAPVPK